MLVEISIRRELLQPHEQDIVSAAEYLRGLAPRTVQELRQMVKDYTKGTLILENGATSGKIYLVRPQERVAGFSLGGPVAIAYVSVVKR